MKELKKMMKVWRTGTEMSVSREMSYRLQFFLFIIVRILWGIAGPVFMLIIYKNTMGIPGWSFEELILFYGTASLSFGIAHTLFIDLIHWMVKEIELGTFDNMLLKPIRIIPLMLSRGFSTDGIADMGVGIALTVYAFSKLGNIITPINLAIYFGLIGISVLMWLGIVLFVIGTAFIYVRVEIIWEVLDTFFDFGRYPLDVYSTGIKIAITFLLPVSISSFYPAVVLIQKTVQPFFILGAVFSAIALFVFGYLFFKQGIKRHTSAGG